MQITAINKSIQGSKEVVSEVEEAEVRCELVHTYRTCIVTVTL